jgi:hypothetical protein
MKPPHAVTTLKICNGACHFEHPAVAPRGQLQPRSGIRQQSGTSLIRRCRLFQFGKRRVGVNRSDRVTCHMPQPLCLDVTRPGDARANFFRAFRGRRQRKINGGNWWRVVVEIDPVQERTGQAGLILLCTAGTPPTGGCAGPSPTPAWIHGSDQLKPRRIPHMPVGPRHHGFARLKRLSQTVEHRCGEFRYYGANSPLMMGCIII